MANVVVQDLVKVYDNDVEAVKGIDFEVHDGEFVVIVGPSGCGKSSTLRMIAGLETITGGTVRIGDEVVNDVPPKHRDIAMVFQNYALYPHMSSYQNLAFGLKMRKVPKDQIDRRVRDAAGILGIEDILDRKPKQLSGGQRQRVAVGRAIVRDPAVFLFDEPLSNLDAKLRVQMRTEISKLHQRLQATMVYVTHDQVEAMTMGDRIVVMDMGEIQQVDTPLNIYNRPANRFVAGFIGSSPMNFLEGRVTGGESPVFEDVSGTVRLPLDAAPWEPSNLDHDELSIGFRPEDLYLVSGRHKPDRTAVIHLVLDVLEPMGNEIVLYLRDPADDANGRVDELTAGDSRIIARIAPEVMPEVDSRLEIAVDLTRLHVFDGRTGERL